MRLADACQREARSDTRLDAAVTKQLEHSEHIVHACAADAEQVQLQPDHVGGGKRHRLAALFAGNDEAALIAALRDHRIAGAGLDVFQNAPLPVDSPFWDLPNVFITPNVGGYIVEYEDLIIPLVIDNMRLFLAGRQSEMQNIVAH